MPLNFDEQGLNPAGPMGRVQGTDTLTNAPGTLVDGALNAIDAADVARKTAARDYANWIRLYPQMRHDEGLISNLSELYARANPGVSPEAARAQVLKDTGGK